MSLATRLEDYVEVISVLEGEEGPAAYELNNLLPNVKKGGMQFGSDPGMAAEVVSAARKAAGKKAALGQTVASRTEIGLIARAVVEARSRRLTVSQITYPAMSLEFRTGKSKLGNKTGGLSGPAIKPINPEASVGHVFGGESTHPWPRRHRDGFRRA